LTRSWQTLLPAALLFGYFFGAVPLFALRVRRRGMPREERIEARRPSRLLPKWLIYYLLWAIAPVERTLVRVGVAPNALTFIGLLVSCGAGAFVSHGYFDVGGWLYLIVGIIDIFDGRVARATGRVSRSGAFYDSVVDRYSECAIFVGLIIYYHQSWVMYVILGALVGSLMVSYTRARAEALGMADASVGLMQRPERVLLLGVAMASSPFVAAAFERPRHPDFVVTVAAVLFLALSANLTAISRFWAVFRHLRAQDPPPRPAPRAAETAESAATQADARLPSA
jgi:CDP-diacylglycerol--glycerol-3-phosphate 3-phosphatidyltransferase